MAKQSLTKQSKITLAKGVQFDPIKHEYHYKGKQLSGITGVIAKSLRLNYDNIFTEEARETGVHVHRAIQTWIETGEPGSIHPGVWFVVDMFEDTDQKLYSEVLVSDFKQYASSIDIIGEKPDGSLVLYDIKAGVFKREYVSWQLSVYKYLAEKAGKKVDSLVCISLKDSEFYPIFSKTAEKVEKLLYGG